MAKRRCSGWPKALPFEPFESLQFIRSSEILCGRQAIDGDWNPKWYSAPQPFVIGHFAAGLNLVFVFDKFTPHSGVPSR